MKIISVWLLPVLLLLTVFVSNQLSNVYADTPQRIYVNIDGEDYPLGYNITNAAITNATSDENKKTLMIEIVPTASGKLGIELARYIIDSNAGDMNNKSDAPFVVTLHERSSVGDNTTTTTRIVTANETFTNNSFRNLEIDFSEDTYMISIAGTYLVPEFGPLPILAAALSIGGIIFVSKFGRTISSFMQKQF